VIAAFNRDRQMLNGSRILLLGVSYKRNTADARETPAAEIARQLHELGADVCAADPHVSHRWTDPFVERVDLTMDEVSRADAVVIITDHDDFDYDLVRKRARYVLDTRHRLDGPRVEHL
jgi:UDP-N-acetyl-D-glucosamine dehydrogenase